MKKTAGIWVCLGAFICAMSAHADVAIGTQVIKTGTEIKVLEPGPDLQGIIDGIMDEGPSKPYLIRLGPGKYTILPNEATAAGLVMAPYVSIVGSGQGVTILKGAISSGTKNSSSAIVTGASNTILADLSVENAGGSSHSIAIYNLIVATMSIERVTVTASGGLSNNYGVYSFGSSPTLNEVTATALGVSTGSNYGVYIDSSTPIMIDVVATASGGVFSYGAYNTGGGTSPFILRSVLIGGYRGMRFNGSTGTRITNSQIIGGIDADPAGVQCRNTYDENLADVTC